MKEVFLCAKHENKKLSAAIYTSENGSINFSESWMPVLDSSSLSQILFQFSPTAVLISSKSSEELKAILSQSNTISLPKSDFVYDFCRAYLLEHFFKNDELLAATSLDFMNKDMISCCGALLKFLLESGIKVYSIKFTSFSSMFVDFQTLQALQIIKEDPHPSLIKTTGRAKEGFSILTLLDNSCTKQGKRKIKEILLRPFKRIDSIECRLDSIEFFLNHLSNVYDIIAEMKNISDLESIMKRFREFRQTGNDWNKLRISLSSFVKIHQKIAEFYSPPMVVQEIVSINLSRIVSICSLLENCLIFSNEKPHIQNGVSEELDFYVNAASEINEHLSNLTETEKIKLKSLNFSKLCHLFIQGFGYVLELSFENGNFPDKINDEEYSFLFAVEDRLYFKTLSTAALYQKFGDINSKIQDVENSILLKIEEEILKEIDQILLISLLVGDLDAIISLVLFADSYHLTRPVIFPEPRLQVVNGRHLLVELCVSSCIPNDCDLDNEHRIGLITGPNYSGKSVYMKTMGIIAYLAHIGSFVPAEIAEIGVLDSIFTRMSSTENRYSCSFIEEISQVAQALENCTERSLVLIDEFGKGTCIIDGISLFVALVQEFLHRTQAMVMLTTHYQELFIYELIKENEIIKFYTMEMAQSENPVFLYKLIRGVSRYSYGILCAKNAGVEEEVIKRAEEIRDFMAGEIKMEDVENRGNQELEKIWQRFMEFNEGDDSFEFLQEIKELIKFD